MAQFKTITVPVKASVLSPNSDRYKASAAAFEERYGFRPLPQMDLLYVEAVLVSAGMNENDDYFSLAELWAARQSPMLKPSNWQHSEKDILGVTYSVQARDLSGKILAFDQESAPTEPFELVVESVIYKLIHPDKARDIEERFSKGDLFVSMECYFNDYNYAFANSVGSVVKTVGRNGETAFLDSLLKAKGGSGKHENYRVGRELRGITFGGHGFVDRPANKRSEILNVGDSSANADTHDEERLLDAIRKLKNHIEEPNSAFTKEKHMTLEKPIAGEAPDFDKLIEAALEKHEDKKAKAAAEAALRARAGELETSVKDRTSENEKLKTDLDSKDAQIKALKETITGFEAAVESLVTATAEVVKAEKPTFKAGTSIETKMAWFSEAVKASAVKAARAAELEEQLAIAGKQLREEEVRSIYNGLVTEEELGHLVAIATSEAMADDKAYDLFIKQHKWVAKKLAMKEKPGYKDMKKDKKMAEAGEAADALAGDETEAELQQGDLGISSGVNPGQLRTPRFKIAGSKNDATNDDPASALENADADSDVNLAGSGREADGDEELPEEVMNVRALATELFGTSKKSDKKAK